MNHKTGEKRGSWVLVDSLLEAVMSCNVKNTEHRIQHLCTPCKLYVKNLMSKIKMRPYNSVQMSIQH